MDNLILDAGLQNTNEEIELELATKNTRFANFIIDHILAYATIYFLTYAVVLSNPYILESITGNPSSTKGWDYLFSYSGMFLYYFISEFLLKGRTIGKMITGTRAITTNFTYLTAGDAAKRTISRLIPFDAFSFLGREETGWHDKWTDTIVVKNSDFKRYSDSF